MRLRALASGLVALALVACGSERVAPPARLEGTFDLVQVGELVFVTSTAGSELRVLDVVTAEGESRDYVRAPNPLAPLSIPLGTRSPLELVTDTRFEGGQLLGGNYVFARGAGSEISVVGASTDVLRELALIEGGGAVTAFAALGTSVEAPSTLFYAVDVAGETRLWSLTLPPPAELNQDAIDTAFAAPGRSPLLTLARESIVALAVLPGGRLAIGTRALAGLAGRSLVIDPADGLGATLAERTVTTLPFPAPVRFLAINPAYDSAALGRRVEVGERIYALLEEEACASGLVCSGLHAVSTIGDVLETLTPDGSLGPMFPIAFNDALPLEIAFIPQLTLEAGPYSPSLMGVVPASDGFIYYVDLDRLQHLDLSAAAPVVTLGAEQTGEQGLFNPAAGDTPGVAVSEALRTETISVVYQGALPGLQGLEVVGPEGTALPVPPGATGQVQVGDELTFLGCAQTPLTVSAVTPVATDGGVGFSERLEPSAPPDPACTAFSVAAGAASTDPWVVSGSESGLLGRARPDVSFAAPFGETARSSLSFVLRLGGRVPERGLTYSASIEANLTPYRFTAESTQFRSFVFPASVVYVSANGLAYAAYPSANAVLEFPPGQIRPDTDPQGNASRFRQTYR